jgi:hypothetical protein
MKISMPSSETDYRIKGACSNYFSAHTNNPALTSICCAEDLQQSTFKQDPGLMIQLQSPSRHSCSRINFDIHVGLRASKDGCLQGGVILLRFP